MALIERLNATYGKRIAVLEARIGALEAENNSELLLSPQRVPRWNGSVKASWQHSPGCR